MRALSPISSGPVMSWVGPTCPLTCLTAPAGRGQHGSGAGQVAASGMALGSVRRRMLVSGAHGGFVGVVVFCSGTSFHGGARWLLKVSPYQVSHLRA